MLLRQSVHYHPKNLYTFPSRDRRGMFVFYIKKKQPVNSEIRDFFKIACKKLRCLIVMIRLHMHTYSSYNKYCIVLSSVDSRLQSLPSRDPQQVNELK